MDRAAFADKLRRALEALPPESAPAPAQTPAAVTRIEVDVMSAPPVPVFRWKTTVERDAKGQITACETFPIEEITALEARP
jgi:hypothetical protein